MQAQERRGEVCCGQSAACCTSLDGCNQRRPIAHAKASRDPTSDWERRDACSQTDINWLLRNANHVNRLILLLGTPAGLRVSEMTVWEGITSRTLP